MQDVAVSRGSRNDPQKVQRGSSDCDGVEPQPACGEELIELLKELGGFHGISLTDTTRLGDATSCQRLGPWPGRPEHEPVRFASGFFGEYVRRPVKDVTS